MRHESSAAFAPPATGLRCIPVHRPAIHCSGIHAAVARAIWPHKTAEHWAAAAGVKPRMACYWLAGHEVSDAGKLALIRKLG